MHVPVNALARHYGALLSGWPVSVSVGQVNGRALYTAESDATSGAYPTRRGPDGCAADGYAV